MSSLTLQSGGTYIHKLAIDNIVDIAKVVNIDVFLLHLDNIGLASKNPIKSNVDPTIALK